MDLLICILINVAITNLYVLTEFLSKVEKGTFSNSLLLWQLGSRFALQRVWLSSITKCTAVGFHYRMYSIIWAHHNESVLFSILESVVGFRYGMYAHGTVHVGSPDEISFIPEEMKKVIKVL